MSYTPGNDLAVYGGGYMGSAHLDGVANPLSAFGMTLNGGIYACNNDLLLTGLTIDSGVTLIMAADRLFVRGVLTNNGIISSDGSTKNAVGSTAGAIGAFQSDPLYGASGSGYGGTGGAPGSGGGAGAAGAQFTSFFAGRGGAGGAGTGGAGGLAGNNGASGETSMFAPPWFWSGQWMRGGAVPIQAALGSGGGGGAGASATNSGGGGGAASLPLLISAYQVLGTGQMQAIGGAGAAGGGAGAGGGGGGGGGLIIVVSSSVVLGAAGSSFEQSNNTLPGQTFSVAGGAGGASGGAGGSAGNAGGTGLVVLVPN